MERKFYDIHYHLFDLSHPNLLAFLIREDLITRDAVRMLLAKLPFIINFLPVGALRFMPGKISQQVKDYIRYDAGNFRNLLSVMEGAIEYHFLYVEYFLKNVKPLFGRNAPTAYSKVVICPLLLDFGYKNLDNAGCFYNIPPGKPITSQVVDLLNAIYYYYNYDLILHPDREGRLKIIPTATVKEDKLFEIYPFLGINTRNYDLPAIVMLFDKYFRDYENDTSHSRREKLFRKLGTVKVDLEDMIFHRYEDPVTDFYSYLFAGIKLYPPVGFDPWPADEPAELEKVRFLYSECARRKIPLTVHCSDGGFITSPRARYLTDPSEGWAKVLSCHEYRHLKINFAHLGSQSKGQTRWTDTILSLIQENGNVFTDTSCQTPASDDYMKVKALMDDDTESNILFGSDFVINLIWSRSYNEYLDNFMRTTYLNDRQKQLLCETNPERFLFG